MDNKINKFLGLTIPLLCSFFLICIFSILFFIKAEAQIAQVQPMNENKKLKLSGLYVSIQAQGNKQNRNFKKDIAIAANDIELESVSPSNFPLNEPDYKELKSDRTLNSRTFKNNSGGIIIQYSSKNINFIGKENKLRPIDVALYECSATSFSYYSEEQKSKSFWSGTEQKYPTYLFKDGSSALSYDEKNIIIFNKNCSINEKKIDVSNYTVGKNGMYIISVIPGVDKKIMFNENSIETDYIINEPIKTDSAGLKISEEIILPEGYYIRQQHPIKKKEIALEDFIVYSEDGIEKARFKAPYFYDSNNKIQLGEYKLVKQFGKLFLEILVPGKWLNDSSRVYPITIDPIVTGPVSNYPSVYMSSCQYPNFQKDSILITIPPNITITKFIVEDSYFADLLATPTPTMLDGYMSLSTSCGSVTFNCNDPSLAALPGTCYLVPNTDLKSYLACCFSPSCSIQSFYLIHGLSRVNLGPGCNQTYIYYSPVSLAPPYPNTTFSAFIVGNTVETVQPEWSVSPVSICSDSCNILLNVSSNYGVPPYNITHPWATAAATCGASADGCNSNGSTSILLTIPGCPNNCGITSSLSVPPPSIVDICGNIVTGLSPKLIVIKPVPDVIAYPSSVCSGSPVNIAASSCVNGSSFEWTGDNGTAGTGIINDLIYNNTSNIITINYTIVPTANGCKGPPTSVSVEIDTLPLIFGGNNDTINQGESTQLNAIGALTYLWTPSSGLSCTNCPDPLASPIITTNYSLAGTNENGCVGYDTLNIYVKQGSEVLYIPNSFSPNQNFLNDNFRVYGSSIKTIEIKIFNRWGELLFKTNDINQGWDGKYKGKPVEEGVYAYAINCEWLSGAATYRNGIVTVLR